MAKNQPIPNNPRFQDLTGQVFGRLTVLAYAGASPSGAQRWLCGCDCGRQKVVQGGHLKNGSIRDCSCRKNAASAQRATKHGQHGVPEYIVWKGIRARCHNLREPAYSNYGGRGIKVCDRWDHFEKFLADMGKRPSQRHTLERKNNHGPYSPENCIWADRQVQARNTRRNRYITANGETLLLCQWAERLGVRASVIVNRCDYYGWTEAEAVLTPLGQTPFKPLGRLE